jgi:ParB-like chromosome segregation protein Spo0J
MNIETTAIAQLVPDPKNARRHDARSIEAIAHSLSSFGQQKPIVVTDKGVVVAGNGTLEAAKQLGWSEISVVRLPKTWTKKQVEAFAIADNRTADLSEWDIDNLVAQLGSFDDTMLDQTGFTSAEMADLLEFQLNPFVTVRENVDDLKPHPRNYQYHPDDQLDQIIASINQHGFYRNIVVAEDNTILAGHGVVMAVKKMGKTRVPVIRLPIHPDDPRALKVLTSDNEINNLAEVDDRMLTEMLKEIMAEDPTGLSGSGFNEQQLATLAMITRPASEINDIDEALEWVGLPEYVPEDRPRYQVLVSFKTEEARTEFANLLSIHLSDKGKQSTWYPQQERRDLDSVRWAGNAEA